MFRSIVVAATSVSLAVMAVPVPVTAQQALSPAAALGCGPGYRVGPLGQRCVALKLKRPSVGTAPTGIARPEGVPVLTEASLAETYECEEIDAVGGVGVNEVVAFAEDCGEPLVLTNTQPYWPGEIATAPPPQASPVPATLRLPPAPVAPPSPPPVAASVPAAGTGFTGISNAALFGAAALAGLGAVAIAAAGGGGSSTPDTN